MRFISNGGGSLKWCFMILLNALATEILLSAGGLLGVSAVVTQARLESLSKSDGGEIKLTDSLFNEIIRTDRDYSVVILITAEGPRYNCALCSQFRPTFDIVASSWFQDHPHGDGVYFAVANFPDAQMTFQSYSLTTAPHVWLFPPGNSLDPIAFTFRSTEFLPETIQFLKDQLKIDVRIRHPFPWKKLSSALISAGVILSIIYAGRKILLRLSTNSTVWAGLSIGIIFIFVGGQMFATIRKVPFIGASQNGPQYFAPSFSQQFGVETQIIAAVYASLTFTLVFLLLRAPRIKNPKTQGIAIIITCLICLTIYSAFISIFKIKNGAYPFSLPPFMH